MQLMDEMKGSLEALLSSLSTVVAIRRRKEEGVGGIICMKWMDLRRNI